MSRTISLIIPAYNEERYIGACLEHVQKHASGKFHEIIVVDNASTDGTAAVAQTYPGVRVVREDRKGLAYARQAGFSAATGTHLAYIDADTRIHPSWYRRIERVFDQHADTALLSGPFLFYDVPSVHQFITWSYWHLVAYPMYRITGYMATGGNFIIRREVLEAMGGFDTSIAFYGEDTNIARRASEHGRVRFIPRFFIYTSGRRLAQNGWIKTGLVYTKNFLSEVFMKRPSTQAYDDIR